jgi:CRISPR-associated protein Cas2
MQCLIAYDISDSRRLQRVHRHLQQYARAIQRSVFLFEGEQADFDRCFAGIEQRINRHHDDVRVYAISTLSQLITAGRPLNPEGIWLSK